MSCKHIPYQDGNICTSSDFKKMIKDKPYNIQDRGRFSVFRRMNARQGTVLCLNADDPWGGIAAHKTGDGSLS